MEGVSPSAPLPRRCGSREPRALPDSQPLSAERRQPEAGRGFRSAALPAAAMPHFTVTKVDDPGEGAAASGSQEPSGTEVKTRGQDSDERGEYSGRLGEPRSFRERW